MEYPICRLDCDQGLDRKPRVSQRRSLLRFRNRWIANVDLMGGNLRLGENLMIARKSIRWEYGEWSYGDE